MSSKNKSRLTAEDLPYRPCVGIMLLNRNGKVWSGRRMPNTETFGKTAYLWQMPQGGIDKGEDARDAAFRELEEETGITPDLVEMVAETDGWLPYELPHDLVPKLWKGRFRGQEQKYFLMRFTGSDTQINIETEEPEFSSWRWLAPADLPDAIVPFKRDVYLRVLAAFERHL